MSFTETKLQRRVAGWHDIRMDGMTDLVMRAPGRRVLDVGCNRGLVGFEFANNGAKLVHGVDNYVDGIMVARHLFCDLRNCESRFEVTDLSKGAPSLVVLGNQQYDITLMLATYHKLKRVMKPTVLQELVVALAVRTEMFFGYRGTSEEHDENEAEIQAISRALKPGGFEIVHRSMLSEQLGVAIVWKRNG